MHLLIRSLPYHGQFGTCAFRRRDVGQICLGPEPGKPENPPSGSSEGIRGMPASALDSRIQQHVDADHAARQTKRARGGEEEVFWMLNSGLSHSRTCAVRPRPTRRGLLRPVQRQRARSGAPGPVQQRRAWARRRPFSIAVTVLSGIALIKQRIPCW